MTLPTPLVLDPAEVASNRTELNLNSGSIRLSDAGPDWGDAQIAAYMADLAVGSTPVDFRIPNRQIRIPLVLGADGKTNFQTARANLQQKVALLQREGGWLKRETGLYADIVNATLSLPDKLGYLGVEADVILQLEAIPDFYGDEVTLSSHTSNVSSLLDDFSSNTIANYTFDAGAGTLSVSGGQLVPSSTAEKRLYRSASLTVLRDSQATLKINYGATRGAGEIGLILCRLDANNYLYARQTGGGFLIIGKSDGGAKSDFGGPATVLSGVSDSTDYWVRFRREGDVLTAEIFTSAPTATSAAAHSATWTLTGADATKFGQSVDGTAGIYMALLNNTNARADDFTIESICGALRFTETGIQGDHPGRLRIVLTEASGNDQLGLLYALRSRHYDAAPTAALIYLAGALTPLDLAARAGLAGASIGRVVQHANLGTNWTPVLSTDLASARALTHQGSYRVWARVYSSSATPPSLRFLWDVGDLTNPTVNDAVAIPGSSNLYLVDLGEVRLDPAATGTHRWKGVVQAKGASGGENISIAKVILEPLDEYAGRAVATVDGSQGLAAFSARDEFNQSAGSLAGKALPVGGTWSGAGDADDFTLDTTNHYAQRNAASDVDVNTGRYEIAGTTTLAATVVKLDLRSPLGIFGADLAGALARYVDTNNWLLAALSQPPASSPTFAVRKRVAGTVTQLGPTVTLPAIAVATAYTLALLVDAGGRWFAWWGQSGSALSVIAKGQDSALATGGALASGKAGVYDANTSVIPTVRQYDNFAAWAPTTDAAIYANRRAELRWDGTIREASDGGSYGPTTPPIGDLPRVPPAGQENRPIEVLVKPTRGDFDQIPDSSLDATAAQLQYRPSWLFRPSSAAT